jgi:AhpD family alkylhydroperoxidase
MTTFEVHTIESAPEQSKPVLAEAKKNFGSIPNLFGVFAESPAILEAYANLGSILEKSTLFDPTELQVVLLTTSFENDCDYCMAAHSAIASMQKVAPDLIQSLRNGAPIQEPKLEALRMFTRAVVQEGGFVPEAELESFFAAGYTKRHVLEVILGVGFKTLSNFANHIAATPLDASFQRFAWSRPETAASA